MDRTEAIRLFPTLPMIAEALAEHISEAVISDSDAKYAGVRLFRGQPLRREFLYVVDPADAGRFPADSYAWVSPVRISGGADHLNCPGRTPMELLELLLELFSEFQALDNEISGLLYRGGEISDLCELGERLLGNPICIHDNWFMILARSRSTGAFMPFPEENWEAFPQQFLDEFRMDEEYQRTYEHRGAHLWYSNQDGHRLRTLYVNLFEKDSYIGRILVTETLRSFCLRDYAVAELLAQQAVLMLKSNRDRAATGNRSTDDILYDILNGKYTAASEFSALMRVLQWEKNHRFLCVCIRSQEPLSQSLMDRVLHRELFRVFPGSYILFSGSQQSIIVNLSKTPFSLAMVRHTLAPLCRDYYQYGGISAPVEGIRELPVAYHQAQEALSRAFELRSDQWIIQFHSCALEYILTHLNTQMQLRHLVAPQLLELMEHDRQKGSQLFETIKVYLDNERDIPKTAAKLIIHRTTLTYRLKRIASIMDLNLDDPDVRLYLRLSLRMLEQEKTVKLSELAEA